MKAACHESTFRQCSLLADLSSIDEEDPFYTKFKSEKNMFRIHLGIFKRIFENLHNKQVHQIRPASTIRYENMSSLLK